jgi:hypothetical protein
MIIDESVIVVVVVYSTIFTFYEYFFIANMYIIYLTTTGTAGLRT